MNNSPLSFKILLVLIGALALASLAHAQATRTWVSGVGDDANPCSRISPCKTWAGAISKTAAGGEIDALDPGGFGAVTITKSITLDGGGGQVASTLVAGTNGIVVAAASNDVVIIKNMRLDGLLGNGTNSANAGINGIRYTGGKQLIVDKVEIFGFNTSCIDVSGSGLLANVSNSTLSNCTIGLIAESGAHATVQNTQVTGNTTAGVQAGPSGGVVDVDHCNLSFNGTGAQGNGANSFINLAYSLVTHNSVVGANPNGGGISTFAENCGASSLSGLTNIFANNAADGVIPSGAGICVSKK